MKYDIENELKNCVSVIRLFINEQERPRIATYMGPGKGPNGEHQN